MRITRTSPRTSLGSSHHQTQTTQSLPRKRKRREKERKSEEIEKTLFLFEKLD